MHSTDDFVIVEIGNNNEILLTPLESYGMPLLRYQVGDIGIPRKDISSDNYPFEKFSLAIGRSCEILRNNQGEKVHSAKINLEIAKNGLNIGEFQLIQHSIKKVTVNIVKTKNTNKQDVEKVKNIIKKSLGVKIVDVKYLKKYPLEKSGKKIGYKCLIKD